MGRIPYSYDTRYTPSRTPPSDNNNWAATREILSSRFANNKWRRPAWMRSLISAFVIHLLDSIIFKLDTSEILISSQSL